MIPVYSAYSKLTKRFGYDSYMLKAFKIHHNKLKRGNLCLLIGTSAGFSIGASLFRY